MHYDRQQRQISHFTTLHWPPGYYVLFLPITPDAWLGQALPSCLRAAECGLLLYTCSQRLITCVDFAPEQQRKAAAEAAVQGLCVNLEWMGGLFGCGHKMLARQRNRMSSAGIGGVAP